MSNPIRLVNDVTDNGGTGRGLCLVVSHPEFGDVYCPEGAFTAESIAREYGADAGEAQRLIDSVTITDEMRAEADATSDDARCRYDDVMQFIRSLPAK